MSMTSQVTATSERGMDAGNDWHEMLAMTGTKQRRGARWCLFHFLQERARIVGSRTVHAIAARPEGKRRE